MELRQVEYVLAVSDHGNFTKAAAAIGVTQPSLSDGIKRLEVELGARLFHRLGRSVALTDAGRAFVGPARQLVRDRDVVLEAVGAVQTLRAGTLDVVSLPTLAVDPLAGLIGRFRRAHPQVDVHIVEPEDTGAIEEMVADGRSELGLTELPPRQRDLVSIVLQQQEIVAVCPPGTELSAPGRLPIAQLAGMPLITTPTGTSTRDLLDRTLATAGVAAHVAVETEHREAIAPLVLGGAGTSFLPRSLAQNLRDQGAVVARLVPALTRTIGIVHRAMPLTPAARAFVELARKRGAKP